MNGVKNEIHVRIEQTARGVWYCSGADVYGENYLDVAAEGDLLMGQIEKILDKHNKQPEEDTQHTDLSTAAPAYAKPLKVRK
jgi:hypothetical protein